jgi:hypothetical protein
MTVTAADNDGGATSGGIGVTVNPFPAIPNGPIQPDGDRGFIDADRSSVD